MEPTDRRWLPGLGRRRRLGGGPSDRRPVRNAPRRSRRDRCRVPRSGRRLRWPPTPPPPPQTSRPPGPPPSDRRVVPPPLVQPRLDPRIPPPERLRPARDGHLPRPALHPTPPPLRLRPRRRR